MTVLILEIMICSKLSDFYQKKKNSFHILISFLFKLSKMEVFIDKRRLLCSLLGDDVVDENVVVIT